jgi:thiol-disulfide isomerase/thioredoxin
MSPESARIPIAPTHSRRGPKLLILASLAAAGLLLMAACGTSLTMPNFTISVYQGADELGGSEVTIAELLEQDKPLVLNFWAALCPPCRAEMPDIQRMFERHGDDVTIVGVDLGPFQLLGTREEGRALLEEMDVHYPAGTTFDDAAVKELLILGMPTSIFLTADGEVHRKWTGFLSEEKLEEFINEVLAAS